MSGTLPLVIRERKEVEDFGRVRGSAPAIGWVAESRQVAADRSSPKKLPARTPMRRSFVHRVP